MKTTAFCLFILISSPTSAQIEEVDKEYEKSLIEAGSFLNISPMKIKHIPGFYIGYWYRYPIDENRTHLEIGGNFNYSTSLYDFDYGKKGVLYPIHSKEVIVNLGIRMVKQYPLHHHKIEWVSELSFHNLLLNGNNIPDDKPAKGDKGNTRNIYIDTESIASLKLGQGIRFWKNNIGLKVQFSFIPYRLWYRNTVPKGFNSFSVETGLDFKF